MNMEVLSIFYGRFFVIVVVFAAVLGLELRVSHFKHSTSPFLYWAFLR
jgi:hypothetical protein